MQRILILLSAWCLLSTAPLFAQVPENISVPYPVKPDFSHAQNHPEFLCNYAGTFQLGALGVNSQTNDTTLKQIFLCHGDSIFIDHNGDFDLSGDPIPGTQPGIGWAFYTCSPSVQGDNLQTILTDPCLLPGAPNGIWVYTDQVGGDAWFFNSGVLQNSFNGGQPLEMYFAPITLDILNGPVNGFESAQVGFPPGPCVNVNTTAAFSVVYLNAIQESGVSTNFGNDCLGKFRIQGGYPEWDGNAVYTIDISLAGNPSVKALIHTAQNQLFHGSDVIFSVPQSGTYNVTVEDGKSCGYTFQITMNTCDATDNVVLILPEIVSPPGSTVCIPITVENYNSVSASFSVTWDPTILQYTDYKVDTSLISGFSAGNINAQNVTNGELGVVIYDQFPVGAPIVVADGDTLLSLCFNVLAPLGSCTPLDFNNSPTPVIIENDMGQTMAVTADTGQFCVDFLPLSLQVNVDTLCLGLSTITVKGSGGMAPYEVIIDQLPIPSGVSYIGNIATEGGTFTTGNVVNGSYIVRLTDQNGLGTVILDTIDINNQPIGAALDLTSLPFCFGDSTGSVAVTVYDGTTVVNNPNGLYSFTWTGPTGPYPSFPFLQNVPAGNYSCIVTSLATGCSATAAGTLGQPLPISRDAATTTPASCSGVCDGTINYAAEGGTPISGTDYNYSWYYSPDGNPANATFDSNSSGAQSVLTNKCAGTYYVTVTDGNNCIYVDSIVLGNLRTVTLNVTTLNNVSCNGLTDGEICVTVTETPASANPSYLYFWQPATGTQANNGLTSCYQGLAPGNYSVLAVDAVGCAASANATITAPTAVDVQTFSVQNPTCFLPSSGKIQLSTTGGTGNPLNYTYNWSTGATGAILNNVTEGNYCATVTDQNGCVDSICVDLLLPSPPIVTSIDSIPVKCANDGCLSVNTSPLNVNYFWTDLGTGASLGTTQQICNLNGGTYEVKLVDNGGCTSFDTISLATVPVLVLTDTTLQDPVCFGDSNGIISVGVGGGNGGYTYTWSPNPTGVNANTLANVQAGCYNLTVKDVQGCTITATLCLNQPPQIVNTFSGVTDVTCFSKCDGKATPTVKYSNNTTGNFNFQWSDGSSDSIRTTLCAGVNTVTISDVNNCFITAQVTIGSPAAVTATGNIDSTSCFGLSDGSIIVTPGGGNGAPFTYMWSPNTNTTTSTPSVSGLAAGTYVVTVSDKNNCTTTASFQIGQPAQIVVAQDAAQTDNPDCFGSSDGALGVTVSGGNVGVLTYAWSDGTNAIGTTNPLEDLSSGTYSVTVTDALGCTGLLENMNLIDPPAVLGDYNPWAPLLCNGDETILTVDTIYGGSGGPYKYSLDFGVTLDPGFPITIGGGEHYITYYDGKDCSFTDTIEVFEPDAITVTFDPATIEIELGDSIQLNPIVNGAVVDSFIWAPANLLTDPTSFTPFVYSFESETFKLTVFDENGCVGSGEVTVNIDPNRNVYLPNVFYADNSRGLNDHFNVWTGRGVERVNYLRVYDRWGELMYTNENFLPENQPSDGWDGKYQGKFVMPGVYIYICEVKFLDGRELLYRGDVTVVR